MPCFLFMPTAPSPRRTTRRCAPSPSLPRRSCPPRSGSWRQRRKAAPFSMRRARHGRARRWMRLRPRGTGPVALPVAVGVACAGHGIACEPALQAFLHALTANWISAGVRLIPLGQSDGQRVLAALEPDRRGDGTARAQHAARRDRLVRVPRRSSPACATRPNTRGYSGRKHHRDGAFICRRSTQRPALAIRPVSCRRRGTAASPTWSGPAPRW